MHYSLVEARDVLAGGNRAVDVDVARAAVRGNGEELNLAEHIDAIGEHNRHTHILHNLIGGEARDQGRTGRIIDNARLCSGRVDDEPRARRDLRKSTGDGGHSFIFRRKKKTPARIQTPGKFSERGE
jgi:hypothetical protein